MSAADDNTSPGIPRRSFLCKGTVAVAGAAAGVAALSPLRGLKPGTLPSMQEFLQKHYKEMSDEDKREALARIAADVEKRYKVKPNLDADPRWERTVVDEDGKEQKVLAEYVYGLNLSRCIGCRKCVHACVKENNQSREPEIQYIRVMEMKKGGIDVETSDHHYDPPQVPDHDKYYMPVQCHQCSKPPCVKVCPVGATWQEPDGITVVDYDWCIGCRYCEAACPYWARRFNFTEPKIPREEMNPNMGYLANRPRTQGVMEKCTFCLQRTRKGKLPACLEVCPTGSRKFGNILDPESEVAYILKNKRVFVLKEEVGTAPRFFYYFDERGSRYHEPISPVIPGGEA